MNVKELMDRYRVKNIWASTARIDYLFSDGDKDPYLYAYMDAGLFGLGLDDYWTVSVGIGPNMMCITQIIVFKDRRGYEDYHIDGVVIFDGELI